MLQIVFRPIDAPPPLHCLAANGPSLSFCNLGAMRAAEQSVRGAHDGLLDAPNYPLRFQPNREGVAALLCDALVQLAASQRHLRPCRKPSRVVYLGLDGRHVVPWPWSPGLLGSGSSFWDGENPGCLRGGMCFGEEARGITSPSCPASHVFPGRAGLLPRYYALKAGAAQRLAGRTRNGGQTSQLPQVSMNCRRDRVAHPCVSRRRGCRISTEVVCVGMKRSHPRQNRQDIVVGDVLCAEVSSPSPDRCCGFPVS